jgi:uncharacterized delta-60 repeat protein
MKRGILAYSGNALPPSEARKRRAHIRPRVILLLAPLLCLPIVGATGPAAVAVSGIRRAPLPRPAANKLASVREGSAASLPTRDSRVASGGELDPTFGGDGRVTTNFGGFQDGRGVAIQLDGKIVVAGSRSDGPQELDLARYRPDGTLDPTFIGDGKVIDSRLTGDDVAIQGDGKVIVVGSAFSVEHNGEDVAVVRYNSDGTIDSSFGTNGEVLTDYQLDDDFANGVSIQADGKIVVAGGTILFPYVPNFFLARYNSDGSLDTTFSGDGMQITSFPGTTDSGAADVALQPDGRIVAAGSGTVGFFDRQFAVARYRPNGRLDKTFSNDGRVLTNFSNVEDQAKAISLQSDGKIVVGGLALGSAGYDFALVRYKTDGTLDPRFSVDGKVRTDFAFQDDEVQDVTVQADGKIIAVGGEIFSMPASGDFELARYLSCGRRDRSFGAKGKVSTDFAGDYDAAEATAIQADGKIVVAGVATLSTQDIAIARYLAA